MSAKSKITSKGQVTIPRDIRKAMKIKEGDYLIFEAKSEYEANVKIIRSKPLTSLLGSLQSAQHQMDITRLREHARDDLAGRRNDERND